MPDLQPLYQRAAIIRDAVLKWENTANRIGTLFYDILGQIQTIDTGLSDKYLRKDIEDIAEKKITFEKGIQIGKSFVPGITGEGGLFDEYGNAEFNSLKLRRFLEVPDLQYNRVKITVGDAWRAPGGGIIDSVDTVNKIITLKLEEGEYGEIAVGDKCMGIYHSYKSEENEQNNLDDSRGNRTFAGFTTSYFKVVEILDTTNNSQFRYELRPTSERWSKQIEPYELMHFVAYSNPDDVTRQTARYSTRTYERYLYNMTDWEIGADNIAGQFGDLTNLNIHGYEMTGYSAYLDNVYIKGTIQQFDLIKPMDIMYSSVADPGNPTDNPDNWTDVATSETIWMAIRVIKNGQPAPWDIVYTRGQPGTPGTIGQSTFKSTVFIRSNVAPGTPSGGSYTSPVPTTAGWTDGVPSGSAKLWMATRIFTSDGLTPQQTAWMAPVALTDNSAVEVLFSAVATPGNPTSNPTNWVTNGDAASIWMATRTITNGVAGAWTIAKVKGESGADALTLVLSSENIIVSCDSTGTAKTGELGATGKTLFTVDVYRGATKLTFGSDWQFYNTAYTNIVIGQISGTSTLFLSGITEDSGFGDFTVRIGSVYLTKRLNARKAYDGAAGGKGDPGSPGVGGISMMLVPETWPVMCDSSGVPLDGELSSAGKAITEIKVYLGGALKTYNTDWQFLTCYGTNVTWKQVSGQPKIYIDSISQQAKSGYVDINIQLLGVAMTKRFSVSKVITGAQGLQGCIHRLSQWATGVNYRNDMLLTSGERYVDIVIHRISNVNRKFRAKATHNAVTSSSSNQPPNETYWEELSQIGPFYTPFILADNAVIEFLQGNEIIIMKSDRSVTAGMSGYGSGTDGIRFWAGGATPGTAPFRVDELGNVFANKGIFKASFSTPFSTSYTVSGNDVTLSLETGFNFIFTPNAYQTLNVYLPTDIALSGVDCWLCCPYLTKTSGVANVKMVGSVARIVSVDSAGNPSFLTSKSIDWILHLKAVPLNGLLYWFIV